MERKVLADILNRKQELTALPNAAENECGILNELHKHASETPEVLVYLLVGIGAFAGAFLLNELISRISILRWCVLGIKKEKNHVSR